MEKINEFNKIITHNQEIIKSNKKSIIKLRKEVAQMKNPASNGGRSRRRHKKKERQKSK
jgi:hypothetical protein